MVTSRRRLLASAAAVGALSTSGRVFGPAIAQSKPLRVGILAPRSGIAAAPGLNGIRATQWAIERYNAQGGIGGRKVELVIEDESSPKDTIERFSKLVQQEKVDCVQGIISTGVGLALGPVVEEARALTIYWDGTTQDGVDEKILNPRYLFRSTDNECEAIMSSLLAIKYWKDKFSPSPESIRTTPMAATTWRPSSRCSSGSISSTRSSPSSGPRSAPWT
jgi:branched-chain amino acid transport system substrate-binding protein